jgi:hypothetical protein
VSASTELDRGAILKGLLVPQQSTRQQKRRTLTVQRDRRSRQPIAALSREHDVVCREAVDPAEIAASLEASGLNDRIARERYGVGGVFDLAEILYDLVPWRLGDQEKPRDPWRYPMSRHIGRGILYALPMLPYLAALRVMAGSLSGVTTLLVGSVVAMAVTHVLSYVGHLLVGYGARDAAARLLRRGLLGTLGAGGVLAVSLVSLAGLPVGPVAVAYAQLVYVVASTVIMVFEKERLLLVALLPGVAASVLALTAGDLSGPARVMVAAGLVTCIVLTVASALAVAGLTAGRSAPRLGLVRQEWRRAAAHGAYGAVTAGLLMYAVIDALAHQNPVPTNTLIGIGMLPLVASLGISEWHLHSFRSDTEQILRVTHDFGAFARRVRLALFGRILDYALVLATFTVVVLAPQMARGDLDPVLGLRHLGYGLLGVALFQATLLVSCGLIERVLALVASALLVDLLVRQLVASSLVALTIAHALVFAALMIGLWSSAYRRLGSPLQFR